MFSHFLTTILGQEDCKENFVKEIIETFHKGVGSKKGGENIIPWNFDIVVSSFLHWKETKPNSKDTKQHQHLQTKDTECFSQEHVSEDSFQASYHPQIQNTRKRKEEKKNIERDG